MRKCGKCKKYKKDNQFYRRKSGRNKGYLQSYCKSCEIIYNRKRHKANPWQYPYNAAKKRCLRETYIKKGITFHMTVEDFKKLWFKNKAYLMKKPCIHRFDDKKDYIICNCVYIEFIVHSRIHSKERWKQDKAGIKAFRSVRTGR